MSIDRGMDKDVVDIYNGLLVIKINEIVPFAEMWMDLDPVIQSEICQKEKNKYINAYMDSREMAQMNLFAKQKYR